MSWLLAPSTKWLFFKKKFDNILLCLSQFLRNGSSFKFVLFSFNLLSLIWIKCVYNSSERARDIIEQQQQQQIKLFCCGTKVRQRFWSTIWCVFFFYYYFIRTDIEWKKQSRPVDRKQYSWLVRSNFVNIRTFKWKHFDIYIFFSVGCCSCFRCCFIQVFYVFLISFIIISYSFDNRCE